MRTLCRKKFDNEGERRANCRNRFLGESVIQSTMMNSSSTVTQGKEEKMDTHKSRFPHFVIETYGSFLLTVSIFSVKEGSSSESEERREYWGLRRGCVE